jgi:DNA repair exonuclease SbcCD ATPase subunit
LAKVLEMPQLPAIRTGLQGLENSLTTGAQQVEGLASYTYPVVYWESWRPRVQQQAFWSAGGEIATGMTAAASGVQAADKELETLGTHLPKVRAALESSKAILDRSHETMGTVLKYRGLIEPLVKSLPETAARLAEDLPQLSKQLSATLRETKKLKAVAESLRATSRQLEKSAAAWPEARRTLLRAAEGLKANRDRLDKLLSHHETRVQMADTQETMRQVLPIWEEQIDGALQAEQSRLATLGQSLEQVAEAQAAQGATAGELLTALRWTLAVLAGVMAFQGVTQCRGPTRSSGKPEEKSAESLDG